MTEEHHRKAARLVFEYIQRREPNVKVVQDDARVVWFCKTIQNWKCLISVRDLDDVYYEVTYNGDKHETYIDAYHKFDNVCVLDEDVVASQV